MNPTTDPKAQPQAPDKWGRLAWLPIPLLLAAIIAARMAGLQATYESRTLLLVLSFTFYTLVSLGTLYLIGRSFLASGSPGLLLLECGVLLWSLSGTVGDLVYHGDANINVTIFNIGILLAGLCHLAGAILALRPQQALRAKPVWLVAGCVSALGALWLISLAALSGWLPVFFIPGHGGTPVRYCVLISAISMFVLSAGVLKVSQRTARLPFTSWYALALLMLAVGLFGIMIQLSFGSAVNWLSRTAQWLGGLYLLFASLASLAESQLPLLPPENKSQPAYYRYAIAVAVVLAAAAIRLTFLSVMGMKAPFVTFFLAVMFAALYGGLRAGLLATALSAILADCFWIEPANQLTKVQPSDGLALVIFLLSGAMIAWITESMHRARARATAAETQALLAAEREAASEALQKNEARLRLAQESANVGIWDWMVETGELDFTPELNKLYGLPLGTIKTYPDWRDRVHPDDIGRIEAGRDEAIAKHESFDLEFRGRHSSGEYRWISTKGGATFNEAGKAIRVFGVNIDITERKNAEEILRRQADLLRLSHDAIIVWQLDGGIISWNRGAEQMYGFTENEALGKVTHTLLATIHPEPWAQIESCLRERSQWEGEFVHKTKDGREVIVSARLQLIRSDDAELVLETNRDITERKRAELALQESETRFSTMANAMPQLAWIARADGYIFWYNRRWYEYTGTVPEQMEGWGWQSVHDQSELPMVLERWQVSISTGEPFEMTFPLADADGVFRPFLTRGFPLKDAFGRVQQWFGTNTDVSELKRIEEELYESEQLFRVLIKNLQSAVALVDESGAFMIVNRAFLRMFALADESDIRNVNDRDWSQWQVFDERGALLNVDEHPVRKTALTGKAVHDQLVAVKAPENPELKWILVSAEPIPDAQGHIQRLICTYHDITIRKYAEEALRRQSEEALNLSEQEFRSLAEAMPQIVWATRPDGWNIYFNQQWVDYTGMTMEESHGHGWNKPFHPDDKQRAWEAWQRATQHNERYSLECRLRRADGVYRWWLIRGEPMRGANSEILKWFGTCTDIEEIKAAETLLHEANVLLEQRVAERTAALRESEALYRGIGESIDYGVWSCAPDGRNTYASESFLNMVGITQEQCSNYGWGDVLHPDDAERTTAAWQECVRTGGKWDIEHRFRGTDGQWHHVLARGVPVRNEQGEIISWAGINLDISRLKEAEEQIKESLIEKEVMLKEIHHRVKNNLQVISSLVNLQANGSKDETVAEVLKDVTYRVRSMALVHEKLYQSSDLANVDFAEYARSLLNYLWRAHGATAASVRLTLDLQSVSLPVDTAVPCGLILNELAGNALKHAFQGRSKGELTVSLQNHEDGSIRLRVHDNGVGLPEGLVWNQAPSLGLRLVQMLSKQLGASVEVSGEDGTKFEIAFLCPRSI